jgi:hypothetical protein
MFKVHHGANDDYGQENNISEGFGHFLYWYGKFNALFEKPQTMIKTYL